MSDTITFTRSANEHRYDAMIRTIEDTRGVANAARALRVIAGMRGKTDTVDTWESRILHKGWDRACEKWESPGSRGEELLNLMRIRVAQFRETEATRSKE